MKEIDRTHCFVKRIFFKVLFKKSFWKITKFCPFLSPLFLYFFSKQLSVLGSSGSGKSVLIAEILNNFTKCTDATVDPTYIYCYKSQVPEGLTKRQGAYCYQGIPNLKNLRLEFAKDKKPVVIVFDDLISGKKIKQF